MNNRNFIWIIPLLLIIGYLFGLYLGIPNHLEIEITFSDDVKEMMDLVENITRGDFPNISLENTCEDCVLWNYSKDVKER